jgi:hypothetical protein
MRYTRNTASRGESALNARIDIRSSIRELENSSVVNVDSYYAMRRMIMDLNGRERHLNNKEFKAE